MRKISKAIKKRYQKLPKFLRTKKALLILAILIVGGFLATSGSADLNQIKTAEVRQETIRSEVIATGEISALNEATLHFAVSGKVVWVPVKEGDYVKKWQSIASLDKERYEIALRQAEQDVVAADAELQKVYDDLRNVDVESFSQKITRTAAEATKNKAYDAWLGAKRNLKDTVLTSPIAGTVIDLNINTGEEVFTTTNIAKIGDTKNLQFTAEVDETDIGKVKVDQAVRIVLDAYPEEVIESAVESIASEATTTSTDATVFKVKFNLNPVQEIRLGMNGEVDILIDSIDNALVVPVEAIVEDNKVWVRENGTFSKREVKLGLESDLDVQITFGLDEGETVVVSGFEEIGKKSLAGKILSIF